MPLAAAVSGKATRSLGVHLIAVDDDRHPRDARFGGVADAERFDVEDTAAEQRRDAIQDAGLVFHEHYEGMLHTREMVTNHGDTEGTEQTFSFPCLRASVARFNENCVTY